MSQLNIRSKLKTLQSAWDNYCSSPRFEHFVEFALSINTLAELTRSSNNLGLSRISQELEQQALNLFGHENSHPISEAAQEQLHQQLATLAALITGDTGSIVHERRLHSDQGLPQHSALPVHLISDHPERWLDLQAQLGYFSISLQLASWDNAPTQARCIFLLDLDPETSWQERLTRLRAANPASQLIALGLSKQFELFHQALQYGCDHCFPGEMSHPAMVAHILDLQDQRDEDAYRVLIVDDSTTAHVMIRRALAEHGIETRSISDPRQVLDTLHAFQPDLLLLDMYMPDCNGVEVARIIRQYPEFLSVPIVYLSGETDLGLQIEALRLGGDHFLTKPFNPVFLNAIVKSKIERYRALRRSMYHDSLTGLLNHTSSKTQLDIALEQCRQQQLPLCVAMLDLDHFKQVNDRYGHPVGDQIIRSLAWLLKKRVRQHDILGRYGGEEFILALPNASLSQAYATLELLRQDFAGIHHPYGDGYFQLSFSCGMAAFPALDQREALIQAADDALYRAKANGRNRIECG